jgi:CHAT domain-containing protein/tetratricopeptide (TPR) repeat protein
VTAAPALGVVLLAMTPAPRAPSPATVADCEGGARNGWEAEPSRCFQVLVRTHPTVHAAVLRQLESRLARNASDHAARLAQGLVALDRGDPAAEAQLREGADGMRRAGDARAETHAGRGLVQLLLSQGRLQDAEEAVAAAARAAEASGDHHLRTAVTVLTAALEQRRFQHDRAWARLKEVEPAVFPTGPPWLQAATLSAMGGTLWGLGRHREALECFRRQLDIARAEGDRYQQASALYSVSLVTSRLEGLAAGVPLQEEALAAAVESGNAWAEVSARMGRAQAPGLPLAQRIDQIERALVILRRTRDLGNTCFALRELARAVDELPGGEARAFRAVDEAIRRAREAGDRFHLARGMLRRWNLAVTHWPRERAVKAGLEALDAIEAVRGLQRDEDARARVLSEWVFVYQQIVGYLLTPADGGPALADVGGAFQVTERLRAQELLAALDAAGSTALLGKTRPEHAARQAVLDEIARTQQRLLAAGLPPADREALLADLETLEVRERALRDRLASADAAFATARSPRLATLDDVRRALGPDQALLSYVLRQRKDGLSFERAWLFVVTRDQARAIALADEAWDPHLSVAGLSGLVARRDGSEGEGAARLYRLLLQDGVAQLPPAITRLVIVPDAALHRLPFDALRAEPGAEILARRYEVSVVPSASLWLRLRDRPRPAGAALLALADPRWPSLTGTSIERQAVLWQGLALGGLPRGRREARVAGRSFERGRSLLRVGEQATERFLKTADLRAYGVLHLAAHAVVDDDTPERSAIVLAPGAPEEDGLLQAREIVGLDLSGLIVVLSACRSSSGEVVAGEGPLSLARAFLQAGARAVVGNLWEVRDDEAEGTMTAFYRGLGQGQSVAAALAAARRERILSGAPTAAWAGTVVLGDGDATVIVPGAVHGRGMGAWLPAVLIAAGVLGPLAMWWRRGNSR